MAVSVCFCWVGFNSEIPPRLSFPGVLLLNIPNCGGFLDVSSKLHIWSWSLLIVCPQSEKVYQFSWRGSTIPLALDVGVTHCKPFPLWKHQSQKSQPDSLGAWLRVRVEPICEVQLISCGGQMIQAMFLLRAGVRGAMVPHG